MNTSGPIGFPFDRFILPFDPMPVPSDRIVNRFDSYESGLSDGVNSPFCQEKHKFDWGEILPVKSYTKVGELDGDRTGHG